MNLRLLRNNRRGSSSIIVVVLGLVIVVTIISNIVLWSYEMNNLDWEKMKEEMDITNVAVVTMPTSWFTAQTEYTITSGNHLSGDYTDTHAVDGGYERFGEAGERVNTTLISTESFEGTWPPTGWTETDPWNKENQQAYDGIFSAGFDSSGSASGDLTTSDLNCSDADAIYVDFWYRDDDLDADEFLLRYYDGSTWDTIFDMGSTTQEDQWLHYQQKITDSQYFVSVFKVRWSAVSVYEPENAWIDYVTIIKESREYQCDLNGPFTIDLVKYPSGSIQTVEIQLMYRINDAGEKWFIQAYNWTSGAYSNSGFNSTTGLAPTTGWDNYAVNLTTQWSSYVKNNGTVRVKIVDEGEDALRTTIDIDFLAVRVTTEGALFTFYNDGSFTSHLVSLWVNNATHHKRFDIDLYVNAADSESFTRTDISLPEAPYNVKVVTERGNTAVHTES